MAEGFLYQDTRIKINYFGGLPEEHSLVIGGIPFLLQRGVLEELARTKPSELKSKLSAIDDMIEPSMARYDLSYQDIGFALTQARIKDLEEQVYNATFSTRTSAVRYQNSNKGFTEAFLK